MATRQNLVRLSFYVKRKNGITAEEFQKHWSAHHAEVVADCLAKYGIVKYTQVCCRVGFAKRRCRILINRRSSFILPQRPKPTPKGYFPPCIR